MRGNPPDRDQREAAAVIELFSRPDLAEHVFKTAEWWQLRVDGHVRASGPTRAAAIEKAKRLRVVPKEWRDGLDSP